MESSSSRMGMGWKLEVKIEVLEAGPILHSISQRIYIASTPILGSSVSASADSRDASTFKQREYTPPVAVALNHTAQEQEPMAKSTERGTDWGIQQPFFISKSPSKSTSMNYYVPSNSNHAASFSSSASETPAKSTLEEVSAAAEEPGPEPLQKKIKLEETQETGHTPHDLTD